MNTEETLPDVTVPPDPQNPEEPENTSAETRPNSPEQNKFIPPEPVANAPLADPPRSAFDQANADATALGIKDPEWISRRAFGILESQSEARVRELEMRMRLPEMERQFESEGAPREVASFLPEAMQIAAKLVPDRRLQEQLGRIIALGAHSDQQLKSATARFSPMAETGAPASPAARLNADQTAIARSLMRNFHPGEALSARRIDEFRKEGLL